MIQSEGILRREAKARWEGTRHELRRPIASLSNPPILFGEPEHVRMRIYLDVDWRH